MLYIFNRNICSSNLQLISEFEQFLFPVFQSILQQDISGITLLDFTSMALIFKFISEFMPYVFQLISQMLGYHNNIPDAYQQILPPLLQPVLWESHGLKLLLSAFLTNSNIFINVVYFQEIFLL